VAEPNLLSMTQNILSAMSSDEVNSIFDTTESLQVATIIQNKYYDMLARGDLTEFQQLIQLDPSNSVLQPTLMYVPDAVSSITWVQYYDTNPLDSTSLQSGQFGAFAHGLNTDLVSTQAWSTTSLTTITVGLGSKTFVVASSSLPVQTGQGVVAVSGTVNMFGTVTSYSGTNLTINVTSTAGSGTFSSWTIQTSATNAIPGYKNVAILSLDDFLMIVNRFDPTQNDVQSFNFTETINGKTFNIRYKTDHQPKYCCVIGNYYVLFDSYDQTQDSTLQASKTMCWGQMVPDFKLTDTFVPALDDQQFPLLINEAKSLAFMELKQMPHPKADQEIKRGWSYIQKKKSVTNKPTYFDQLPSFGRTPRTGGYSAGDNVYRWMRQS
jgi:hypothetical protein